MNAKKISLTLSALVLGLTSCGGNSGGDNSLTRKEAYTKLDEIVAATPEKQTKLTAVNNTMADVTDSAGVTTKAGTLITYVFDATNNYSHVIIGSDKDDIKFKVGQTEARVSFVAGNELYAYATADSYVFGLSSGKDDPGQMVTIPSSDAVAYAAAQAVMKDFVQTQIDAFVKCGREHWHNGAGGLSAYLKRQDTLDTKKEDIVVGDETIQAGATENGSYIVLKDEKYTSTGSGNLTLDFDALYPNPTTPQKLHEPLKFEFNNNILTHWYNAKASNYAGNEWTMTYGTANTASCTYSEATSPSAASAATYVVAMISALVAADQPTAESELYPARWGE